MIVDNEGDIYITDYSNNLVRKIVFPKKQVKKSQFVEDMKKLSCSKLFSDFTVYVR